MKTILPFALILCAFGCGAAQTAQTTPVERVEVREDSRDRVLDPAEPAPVCASDPAAMEECARRDPSLACEWASPPRCMGTAPSGPEPRSCPRCVCNQELVDCSMVPSAMPNHE